MFAVGSHQATLKELSRVRHELLKAKASRDSIVQQEMPEADCTKALQSYHIVSEPQDGSKMKDALHCSETSVSKHIHRTLTRHLTYYTQMYMEYFACSTNIL